MSERSEEVMAGKDDEENKAAWLLGVKNIKIQPYPLPPLGNSFCLVKEKKKTNNNQYDHNFLLTHDQMNNDL